MFLCTEKSYLFTISHCAIYVVEVCQKYMFVSLQCINLKTIYLNENLNSWFKDIVNVRYTSKTVRLSFFFVNLSNLRTQSIGDFYKKFYSALFVYSETCFVYFGHSTVQPKIHLNTKFEILPLGWTKCPKKSHFFF